MITDCIEVKYIFEPEQRKLTFVWVTRGTAHDIAYRMVSELLTDRFLGVRGVRRIDQDFATDRIIFAVPGFTCMTVSEILLEYDFSPLNLTVDFDKKTVYSCEIVFNAASG